MEKEVEVQSIALSEGIDERMATSLWLLYESCTHAINECVENKKLIAELIGLQFDIENLLAVAGLVDLEY